MGFNGFQLILIGFGCYFKKPQYLQPWYLGALIFIQKNVNFQKMNLPPYKSQSVKILTGDCSRTSGLRGQIRLVELVSKQPAQAHNVLSGLQIHKKCIQILNICRNRESEISYISYRSYIRYILIRYYIGAHGRLKITQNYSHQLTGNSMYPPTGKLIRRCTHQLGK